MSLEKFIEERKKEIEGKVTHDEKYRIQSNIRTYVDCFSCAYFDGAYCVEQGSYVPAEIIPIGCGKGEPDIPF